MVDNITIKDASGSNVVTRFKDVSSVFVGMSIPTDSTGAAAWGTAGASNANVMSVQGIASGTALPISGSVTIASGTISLPSTASTSTKQSDGSQKTQIVDGSGNVIASTTNALNVAVVSGGGTGGTSSNFAAAFPAAGTAIGAKNGSNMVNLVADASGNLGVAQATGSNLHTVVDSGTITTVSTVTSLSQLAGVAIDLNAGAAGAGTQRVTIDSNQLSALGQAAMASSAPVVIASNQSNIPVINGANKYLAFAASQSITALSGGGGGAAGDYLSHVICVPASTSPGVVTVTDNSTAIVSFPGGASSLSNLAPFHLIVDALSSSGAWKITTGASVSVVCVGKFT